MRTNIALLFLLGCTSSMSGVESAGSVVDDGCPAGEQPAFGSSGGLVCSPVPTWPPETIGSRSAPGRCVMLDGAYSVRWNSDIVEQVRPAFSVTKTLMIAGDHMMLDEYLYELDWIDSAAANVWEPDDTDTWEFRISLECQRGVIVGSHTVTLPYLNPGNQIETWTFEATP